MKSPQAGARRRPGSAAVLRRLAGSCRVFLAASAGWLVISVVGPRLTGVPAAVAGVLAGVVLLVCAAAALVACLRAGGAGRAGRAATAIAEADRMRTALLTAVSHDLRSPLAAAKAAISGLRSRDVELAAADHDELLATAEASLDVLAQLAGSLLDVSRLQAGALSVFPRPADLDEIITRSLGSLGPQARAVRTDITPGLPRVMADPPIMERVIANVTANSLRHSPAQAPPRLVACHRGGRVELRVVDRGPGVPRAEWDRMFLPFQRLANTGTSPGVGLGLAVSRGLIEAMRGTLEPAQTAGGGLTMIISLPAAPRPPRAHPGNPDTRLTMAGPGTSRPWARAKEVGV